MSKGECLRFCHWCGHHTYQKYKMKMKRFRDMVIYNRIYKCTKCKTETKL